VSVVTQKVARKGRWPEFVLLLLALGTGFLAYYLVHIGMDGEGLPGRFSTLLPAAIVLVFGAHLVIRWLAPYADPILFPAALALNGLGLAMIYRIDLSDGTNAARSQLMLTAVSLVFMVATVALIKNHRILRGYMWLSLIAGVALLLLPMVPGLGRSMYGARIWIKIGSYSFQPAELAKIVLAVAFASYLVEKKDVLALAGARVAGIDLPRARDLGPITIMWLASLAVLIYQKDLGTSLLFFGLFVMMLYVATERPSWPILGTVLFLGGAFLGWRYYAHVQTRVSAWLDPFSSWDNNYQIIQGQFGMAWGGLFGTGLGLGRPNLTPLAKNDFIAAALGEELGVAGLMAIIVLYGVIVMRGLRASLSAKDPFSKLLAAGLSFVFALQVFAIIGGVTRLLPLTGLTTPFVSQGGSSLAANYAMLGLLMVVTHQVRRPQAQTSEPLQSLAQDTTQVISVPARTAPAARPRPAPPAESLPTPAGADEPTTAVPTARTPESVPTAGTPDGEPTTAVPLTGIPDEPTLAVPLTGTPDEPTQAIPQGAPAAWDPDDTNPQGRLP